MELVDIYDCFGEKTGEKVSKLKAHEEGLFHKAVHVWIINKKGEVLVQRRNSNKETFPNMLDISFAGHIQSEETNIEAIKREGKEELGLDIELEKLKYLFTYKKEWVIKENSYFENEFDDVFLYEDDIKVEDCIFTDSEVSEVKYIDFRRLEMMWKDKNVEIIDHQVHFAGLFYILHKKFDRI